MELCQKITHLLGNEKVKLEEQRQKTPDLGHMSTIDGLKFLYNHRVFPLEKAYFFDEFHSPPLESADFNARPTVLMVGQYSTGKTTFIRYLLDRDYPGIRIGPEPTTDRFVQLLHRFIAVMFNENEGVVPGNALVVDRDRQFRSLAKYGNAFLNRLQISETDNQVLESLTFVDTPGILSGEKQRTDRGYDFPGVLQWFAERVDRIILMFDANKLDISDEMKAAIESLAGYEHKMRIILNKADAVPKQELLRVSGALMWSLAKVLRTPEAVRVYIGSFWDRPLVYEENRKLFEEEERDLLSDLMTMPRDRRLRLLHDIIQRARLVKVHALVMCALRNRMPQMFNKKSKQKQLIQQLRDVFSEVSVKHGVPFGDFPDLRSMQHKLKNFDFGRLNPYRKYLFEQIDRMLRDSVPKLMTRISSEQLNSSDEESRIKGGKFETINSPMGYQRGEGVDAGSMDRHVWIVDKDKPEYDIMFDALEPTDGKISASKAKQELVKSKLPSSVLAKIYRLSDVDSDGKLDKDEFALAMHLVDVKLNGYDLPFELPEHLVPPSKRKQ